MIATHRWPIKVIYGLAMMLHLFATLLTNSRSNYLALLCAFPLFVFMLVWLSSQSLGTVKRIILSCTAAVVTAVAFWQLRYLVFWLFEQKTHLSEYLKTGKDVVRDVGVDSARLKIWRSSLSQMVSSSERFFFGTPFGLIPKGIKECMEKIYGKGSEFAHAHNIIIQTGLLAGVPGMLLFLGFLSSILMPCVKIGIGIKENQSPGAFVLPIAVLSMLIVNMFEPFLMFYISVMACLFFLFCGYIVAINKETPQSVEPIIRQSQKKKKRK